MTDPVLTAGRLPITPEVRSHPLATKTGLALLGHLLSADQVWSGCTKPQRAVLDGLCRPAVDRLLELGDLAAEDLPVLPERTTTQMRAALLRRGLCEGGRITGKAVHAWYYAVGFKERPKSSGPVSPTPRHGPAIQGEAS